MFTKILLVIVVIVAALFGMRFFRRVSEAGKERLNRTAAAQPAPAAGPERPVSGAPRDAEDLEKCPECGAYVAPHSAVACGRPACPYGR